ncbi:hypothetical protein I2492_13335 [Budviciaceae bacterium CWB-B4]|uniref:DUF7674 domain-containing protein n=1 Tax=Limnobaculum xujianqingii TaxID=2738837 RepID=A0A9D7FUS3_9GAMM|nr:hypothetical protein [Limnobaculum xujianqingii]MBK5073803.1 hypothetical protein [Limnobaculum xujianqingii]MBK5177303.1 hypothetical protein [Limnobaculum xujianqingii]
MNKRIQEYVEELASFSDEISAELSTSVEYWKPEYPPVILLFSQLGKAIVRSILNLDENNKRILFQYIEAGMISDNDELAVAVATGLVEALVTATDDNQYLWEIIEKELGEKSKEHALAWKDFGQ